MFHEMRTPTMMRKFFLAFMNDKMKGTGVSGAISPFFIELSGDTGTTHKELTERIGLNKSLTSRNIKFMMDEGYVENRSDGKEYSLFLTESGVEMRDDICRHLMDAHRYLFRDCTEEEMEILKSVGKKIDIKVDEYLSGRSL